MTATADEVAASLRAKGIKGRINTARTCPIARLVCGLGPEWAKAIVGSFRIFNGHVNLHIDPPEGVCAFIEKFDEGHYPDLVERTL